MRYTEEIRFRENAAVGRSLDADQRSARACIASRLPTLVQRIGCRPALRSQGCNPRSVPARIAARVKTHAGNLLVAMFDQMPHSLLGAFSILDQHGIRLQSNKRRLGRDHRNAASLNHLQSPSVTARSDNQQPGNAMVLDRFQLLIFHCGASSRGNHQRPIVVSSCNFLDCVKTT